MSSGRVAAAIYGAGASAGVCSGRPACLRPLRACAGCDKAPGYALGVVPCNAANCLPGTQQLIRLAVCLTSSGRPSDKPRCFNRPHKSTCGQQVRPSSRHTDTTGRWRRCGQRGLCFGARRRSPAAAAAAAAAVHGLQRLHQRRPQQAVRHQPAPRAAPASLRRYRRWRAWRREPRRRWQATGANGVGCPSRGWTLLPLAAPLRRRHDGWAPHRRQP